MAIDTLNRPTEPQAPDPSLETITVLTLHGNRYDEHGLFGRGAVASSVLLPGFGVDVAEAFSQ